MSSLKVLFDTGLLLRISLPVFHDCLQADFSVDSVELELEIIFSGLVPCDLEYRGSHSACSDDDCYSAFMKLLFPITTQTVLPRSTGHGI